MTFSKIENFKDKFKDWVLVLLLILVLWGIFAGLEDEEGYNPEDVAPSGKYIIK